MAKYGEYKDFKDLLINKKIVEWDKEKLLLDDGTIVTIEMSDSDCCASAGGKFKDVKLDALITDVSNPVITKGEATDWGETENRATVTIFHNQNPIALAECYANDGNAGYYFSVSSFKIKDIYYEVVSA